MADNVITLDFVKQKKKPDVLLWLTDARGVYLPRDFATSFERDTRDTYVSGVEAEDWAVLEAGPDHELYWDVWEGVLDSAVITDTNGVKYTLHQDGDLWLIPDGMVWTDEVKFEWVDDDAGT